MSKTSGGKGTNQHAVKGVSQVSRQDVGMLDDLVAPDDTDTQHSTGGERTCRWGYNTHGYQVLICRCGDEGCRNLREVHCSFCGQMTDALPEQSAACCHCGATIFGGHHPVQHAASN